MMVQPKKIRIIGGAGCGKTTLAKKLSSDTGYKDIALDHVDKRLKKGPIEEAQAYITAITSTDSWIIEGVQYGLCYETTFTNADVIILMDYGLRFRQRMLVRRYIKTKSGLIKTKRKCSLFQLKRLMSWNKQFENNKATIYRKVYQSSVDVCHVRNRQELEEWCQQVGFKKEKGDNKMDLTKLNFFNRKEGEQYKYEYEYEYEYESDEYPSLIGTETIPLLEEKKELGIQGITSTSETKLKEENTRLAKQLEEQTKYIDQLMEIKKKSDVALEQLKNYIYTLKEDNLKLEEQLKESIEMEGTTPDSAIVSSLENELKESNQQIEELTTVIIMLKDKLEDTNQQPKEVLKMEDNVSDDAVLMEYLKRNMEENKNIETRLDRLETSISDLISLKSSMKKKKSSKKSQSRSSKQS